MVNKRKLKAGFTVEAALICPFLCLALFGMIQFTLNLYRKVDGFAEKLIQEQKTDLPAHHLIRLEAITEDLF